MTQTLRIAVVGSINMDVVAQVRRLPDPGETTAVGALAGRCRLL